MNRLAKWLPVSVSSSTFDVRATQLGCWVVAVAVMVLGISKLSRLPLDEAALFFGVVLIMNLTLVMVLIGLVLPIAVIAGDRNKPAKN